MGEDKKEVEVYETDDLPEDKKELQKEVMRLRKEKDKKKWKVKDFGQIIMYSFVVLLMLLVLLFLTEKI